MLTSVVEQAALQRELAAYGAAAARRAWRIGRVDLLPTTLATLMVRAAIEAEAALEALISEQGLDAPPVARIDPGTFGRQTSDGRTLQGLVEQAQSAPSLETMAVTQIADTWRMATGAATVSRPDLTGYVRHVGPTCCSRCAVLSGKFFRWNAGFSRHPGCQCLNVPTTEDAMSDLIETPQDLFDQGRITGLSKANTRAINDGADVNQVMNAYRRTSGMQFAQSPAIKRSPSFRGGNNKFTTEGTTSRGRAGQQQTGLRRNGPTQQRLMPESIYRNAATREDAIRQLKLYGWITDDAGLANGRAVLAERRRASRNERARERRAGRLKTS